MVVVDFVQASTFRAVALALLEGEQSGAAAIVAPLLDDPLLAVDDLTTIATCVIAALAKASGTTARETLLALFDALPSD